MSEVVSYLQFMAWDLWSSSFDQDASDGDCFEFEPSEWKCDNYFGYGRDEIEEDALNAASCVQVLRILITKADTEIEELEKDLLSLQDELALAELENWPEVCCTALTERIKWLDLAVSKLKDDNADGTEMQLLLSNKAAETLNEILKALHRDRCCQEVPRGQQHLDMIVPTPIVNVSEDVPEEDPSNIESNIIMEEGKELCGTSENSRSSELLSELHEKGSDDSEKIKELLAESLVRSPDLGANICVPVHSDDMKLSEALDDITENEDLGRSQLITTDIFQILDSFSSKENGNISSEAKEEKSIVEVKDVCSDGFKATGIKSRKKHIHSRLCAAQQRRIEDSDLDKRICELTPKTGRRASKKEPKIAPDEDFESNLPLQVVYPPNLHYADTKFCSFKRSDGNDSPQGMNNENATLTDAENSELFSLIGMQTEGALYTGLELTDEEKPQDPKSEIAANLHKSNMSSRSKLKAQGKQKPQLKTCAAREPYVSPLEVISSTSLAVSTKRQRKSKTCTDSAIMNESKSAKTMKRALQPGQKENEGRAIVLYDSKFSELQKKRKLHVALDMPNSDGVSIDNGNQLDLHMGKLHSLVDSLTKMNMPSLRLIAKEHNVNKYYKLPKLALVHQLAERLSSC
ncbi:uncharacterized protein LOC130730138 isoform X2 [Lotus japonicus]|uniref:uncharacterized protein LOC130730138 isoform X2 n=1 Tax=Lotus japonicus TaxID=34305 RepID=UPI002583D653|nr:uncharacterized protein LOC130730138 isoform X2 [Lotus japonicus]